MFFLRSKVKFRACSDELQTIRPRKNLIYLKVHPVSRVEAIIEESGAERLKIYPFLFEQI